MKVRVQLPASPGKPATVKPPQIPYYLEQREMAELLAWARERDIDHVVWDYSRHKVLGFRCESCNRPSLTKRLCADCGYMATFLNGPSDGAAMSAEEWECRAQRAENLATRLAQLSIELQARAVAAKSDPIEIEVVPANPLAGLDETLAEMLKQTELSAMTSADLDVWATRVGIHRSSNGPWHESDQSLRERIRARLAPWSSSALVQLPVGTGLRVGDVLDINGTRVQVTDVKFDSMTGTAEIKYTAQLPGAFDQIVIGNVDI